MKLPQQRKQMLLNYLRLVRWFVYHRQQIQKLAAGIMKALVILSSVVILSGCSVFENWVYRIDVPQGNFLEQRDIDQLRVGMTKEQVVYVIGKPVAENVFDDDVWFYVFDYNSGRSRSNNYQNKVKLTFENDRLKAYEGTFDRPENFDIPLEQ